ncbi:isocitrate lyase/phosphoenolpyruvate mutase family protein [Streptomyces sp. NPDC050535]|uniref:isocitrate lyase/phosphoenolpyruvate mutase family protein n=1 Tax=Streptomyces sp. NPDC050535 TaxID=3365626 RepID=UPI0037BC2F2C
MSDSSFAVFSGLHRGGAPLLLPNAWDHASAVALAAQGFEAVGTTSLGVAASAGVADGAAVTEGLTLGLARRLGQGGFLLSVDAEDGFHQDPGAVAELACGLAEAGAVGINLEDGFGSVRLHAAKISAVKAAVPELFVNARTDTYWLGDGSHEETCRRLDAYQQAGADGVFVPGLNDPGRIGDLVKSLDVPLNILYSTDGLTVAQLGDLGVSRVSLGSFLYRRALGAALDTAVDIRAGRTPRGSVPTYAEVQALSEPGDSGTRPERAQDVGSGRVGPS